MSTDLLSELNAANTDEEREWIVFQFSLNNLDPIVHDAVWAAAIPHWFDTPFLAALLDTPDFEKYQHFDDLVALPFIESFPGHRDNVHERTRSLLLKHLWHDDKDRYHRLSQRAVMYCSKQDPSDAAWRIETVYHLLIAEPERGIAQLRTTGWEWYNAPNFAYNKVEALARVAREHADANRLNDQGICQTVFWEALLDSHFSRLPSAKERFLQVLGMGSANSRLAADAAFYLGNVHMRLSEIRQAQERYEEALQIYRLIGITIGEANCLQGLGDVYVRLSEWSKARAQYQKALTLYRTESEKASTANCMRKLR